MCRDVAYWHIRVDSLRRTDSVAIEGIADIGEALLPVGATRMTQLRHGRLKTFAAQKHCSSFC
jgi:hypothetical protein